MKIFKNIIYSFILFLLCLYPVHSVRANQSNEILTETLSLFNSDLSVEALYHGQPTENWHLDETPELILVNHFQDIPRLASLVTSEDIDLTTVDYSKYFVVALFQGIQESTGYEVRLEQARKMGNRLRLDASTRTPFVGERVTPDVTYPYHIAKIDRDRQMSHEMDIALLFNGTQILTRTHYHTGASADVLLARGESSWDLPTPRLEIVDTQEKLFAHKGLIPPHLLEQYAWRDYTQVYSIFLFTGKRPGLGPSLTEPKLHRQANQIIFESQTIEPSPDRVDTGKEHSLYYMTQIRKLYDNGREIDVAFSIDGRRVLTKSHTIADPWRFTTLEKNNGPSGWNEPNPTFMVIATPDEIQKLSDLILPQSLQALQQVDYAQYYVVAVFHGQRPTSGYDITVNRISYIDIVEDFPIDYSSDMLHSTEDLRHRKLMIHSVIQTPHKLSVEKETVSPYHLIQVNRGLEGSFGEGIRNPLEEIEFMLLVNGREVLPQSQTIPDLRPPSPLQGRIYPALDETGRPRPIYEFSSYYRIYWLSVITSHRGRDEEVM